MISAPEPCRISRVYGVSGEPVATESMRAGADLVLFSGDKLLGGPQCGIVVGRKALVQKITAHPLMRALRVDKLTLAALVATLQLHLDRETAERSVPLLVLLSTRRPTCRTGPSGWRPSWPPAR